MDLLDDHFRESTDQYKANSRFSASIHTAWFAFDKYYKLIDTTYAYAAALLLHPSRRKAYM